MSPAVLGKVMHQRRGSLVAMLAVLMMSLGTTGCIETDVAEQIMDNFITEEKQNYCKEEFLDQEENFAPDPELDDQAILDAVQAIVTNPLSAPDEFANLTWKTDKYTINVPANSRPMLVTVEVDWHFFNNANRLGGTLDVVVKDPDGKICQNCHRSETYEPNPLAGDDKVDVIVQIVVSHMVEGPWTVEISGSGFDGLAANTYGGDYHILATATVPRDGPCPKD